MLQLLGGGRLERGVLHTLRIDVADHVPDDAALARGVHALQYNQDLLTDALSNAAHGEQSFLKIAELRSERFGDRRGVVLVTRKACRGSRIERAHVDGPGGQPE